MKSQPIYPAEDIAASGILRLGCGRKDTRADCEQLKPQPHEPASLAELAEAYRGLADVVGLVISGLVGLGVLDPGLLIDGLIRQAAIMRKRGREYRAAPAEFFVQELPEWLKLLEDMMARTQAAPDSKQ